MSTLPLFFPPTALRQTDQCRPAWQVLPHPKDSPYQSQPAPNDQSGYIEDDDDDIEFIDCTQEPRIPSPPLTPTIEAKPSFLDVLGAYRASKSMQLAYIDPILKEELDIIAKERRERKKRKREREKRKGEKRIAARIKRRRVTLGQLKQNEGLVIVDLTKDTKSPEDLVECSQSVIQIIEVDLEGTPLPAEDFTAPAPLNSTVVINDIDKGNSFLAISTLPAEIDDSQPATAHESNGGYKDRTEPGEAIDIDVPNALAVDLRGSDDEENEPLFPPSLDSELVMRRELSIDTVDLGSTFEDDYDNHDKTPIALDADSEDVGDDDADEMTITLPSVQIEEALFGPNGHTLMGMT
ncbi:hypothetical protein CI109_105262 [Kwoniella shandongensis]|uniref:Uncharacterized protein n=1 Tax=Kwoniella shandongensis TaxID=1734106 RepID=A0A5M6C912_9TREE|nr:uncharacterized protein CI109_002105 [Kwoniella shandongensis]KAA5529679.1 hypothetical protein CI109_002105 [Kwoniella shandongensis]